MIKLLAPALLLLVCTPAWGQRCIVERSGAAHTVISAEIDGREARDIITETGPFVAVMKIDPAAKAKGYATRDGEKINFFYYRIGQTAMGKNWREAASVSSEEAGFAFDWPRFRLDGKDLASIEVEMKLGDQTEVGEFDAGRVERKRDGLLFDLTDKLRNERGYFRYLSGWDEEDWFSIQGDWDLAMKRRSDLKLVFRDPVAKRDLATATLRFPSTTTTQAELIKDVDALRAAYAAKFCDQSETVTFGIPTKNALVQVLATPSNDVLFFADEASIVRSKNAAGDDLVTIWNLAVNTKDQSKLVGTAAGLWSQTLYNCTMRSYRPNLYFARVDSNGGAFNPGMSDAQKAVLITKASVEDYTAQFVCGDRKAAGRRLTEAEALLRGRPAQKATPTPAPAVSAPSSTGPAKPAAKPFDLGAQAGMREMTSEGVYEVFLTRRGTTNVYDGVWLFQPTGVRTNDVLEVRGIENGKLIIDRKSKAGSYVASILPSGKPDMGSATWIKDPGYYWALLMSPKQ
jgi:hypothetical protein